MTEYKVMCNVCGHVIYNVDKNTYKDISCPNCTEEEKQNWLNMVNSQERIAERMRWIEEIEKPDTTTNNRNKWKR